jgi:alpha-tubulin suppressor-like RCC1 family protein
VEGLEDFTVTQIASGSYHSLALTQKQKVLMWGWNNEGEAGTGSTQPQSVLRPELITSLDDEKIVRISAGSAHTVALSDSGHVFVWGMHTHGQLGIGRGAPKIIKSPIQLHAMDGVNVTNMACGLYHNLLLTAQGTVWAFGDNTFGSVGTGDNKYVHYFPQKVGALQSKQVIGVAAGAYHSLAVTDQGEVYAWGDNSEGQLGISNHTAQEIWRPAKVSMDHIGPNTTIVQVAAGHSHSLALTSDGIVLAWGSDSNGQCGLGRTGKKQKTLVPTIVHNLTGLNVTQVAAGMFDSFAVSAPGSWLHEPPEEIPVTKSPTFAAVPASLAPSYAPSVVGDTQSPATGNPTNAPSGPGKTGLTSRPSIATAIGWGHASIPPATAGTPPWKAPATVDAPMPGTQPGEDTLVVSKPLVIACAVGLVLVLLAGAAACFVLKRPRQGDFHHLPEDMSDRNDIELSEPESDRSNRRPIKRLRRKIKQKLHEKKAKGRGYGHLGDPDDGSESPSASGTDAESDSSAGNSPSPTKRADPSLASRVANKTLKPKNLQYARVDEEASGSLERNVSDRISPASAEAEADLLSMDPQPSTSATPAAKPPSSDEDVLGIFR